MQIKERRTKILLAFFLLSDISSSNDEISFPQVELSGQFQDIFEMPLNQKTQEELAKLVSEGLFLKSILDDRDTFQLTQKGLYTLSLHFPYVRFLMNKWDQKWRVLSYEIPEEKRELRDRLRREVAGWGLGPWHRSFWLTPHPIIENLRTLVKGREDEQYVQAFEAEHVLGDSHVLIEKVWGKAVLDKKYRELFKEWHDILAKDEAKQEKFKKIVSRYVEVLRLDPGLPKELMGSDWIGYEAFNIFKEIRNILLS